MSETTYLILIVLSFAVALMIGLLIGRNGTARKMSALESAKSHLDEQLISIRQQLQKAEEDAAGLRSQLQLSLQQVSRLETTVGHHQQNELQLKTIAENEKNEKENYLTSLTTLKENFAALKSRNDELVLSGINLTNEKSRLKAEVETLRQSEQLLNKNLAEITARFDEQSRKAQQLEQEKAATARTIQLLQAANTDLVGQNHSLAAKYDESVKAMSEQKQFLAEAQQALKNSFDSLSAAALDKNNQSFLDIAKNELRSQIGLAQAELDTRQLAIDSLVKPLGESLTRMDEKINQLENKREGAYGNISAMLDQMKLSTISLDRETRNLVTALKTSHTRGRYGEIALRRLVEFAGMMDQCDFHEQVSSESDNGKLRPDMIIRLPGDRSVVVDSKVPLSAYLQVFETDDAASQKRLLLQHVAAIKIHLKQLSAKAYWDQFDNAPDFVVLFMQIESSFGAALQEWPELIEEALNNRIIVATPTTLITILRSVGYSWNQLKTMENIESIREAAVELYERSATLMEHMVNVGKSLNGTINHFNKAVGSLEGSFLPQGRKIQQLSQAYIKKQIAAAAPVELSVRPITALPPGASETDGNSSMLIQPTDDDQEITNAS
jgi:DNA recombination protein RmuC